MQLQATSLQRTYFPVLNQNTMVGTIQNKEKKKAMTGPMEMDPVLTMYGVLEKIPM